MNPLGTRKNLSLHLVGSFVTPHINLINMYVNDCLTFAHFGGWLAASFTEIQATVFQ